MTWGVNETLHVIRIPWDFGLAFTSSHHIQKKENIWTSEKHQNTKRKKNRDKSNYRNKKLKIKNSHNNQDFEPSNSNYH